MADKTVHTIGQYCRVYSLKLVASYKGSLVGHFTPLNFLLYVNLLSSRRPTWPSWKNITKEVWCETEKNEVIPENKPRKKQKWMTEEIMMEGRRTIKFKDRHTYKLIDIDVSKKYKMAK